jgi:hypothetical protein
VLVEHGEDSADMAEMFSQGVVVDEYVVEEDKDQAMQEWAENIIHQHLEHRWGITKPKRHDMA